MKLAYADTHRYVSDPDARDIEYAQLLDPNYLAQRARLIDLQRAQAPAFGTAAQRYGVSRCRRRNGHDGLFYSVQLHGIWLWHCHSRYRDQHAKSGGGFCSVKRSSQSRGRRQAALSHHHPGICDTREPTRDGIRRDGRAHATARPRADDDSDFRLWSKSTGRLRRAPMAGFGRDKCGHRTRRA